MASHPPETPFRAAFEFAVRVSALCGRVSQTAGDANYCDCLAHMTGIVWIPCSRPSAFTTHTPLDFSLSNYAYQLASGLYCSGASFVTAFVLVDRLFNQQPQLFCPKSAHKIMAACSVVAVKFTEDRYFTNRRYAGVCGFDLKSFNTIERTLLTILNFTVFVHPKEHHETRTLMRKICEEMGVTPPEALLHPPPASSTISPKIEPPSKKRKEPDSPCEGESRPSRVCARRRWTPEEDAQLLQLVQTHGKQWTLIAMHMGAARDARSCCQRWTSHVNPDIRASPFTAQEDAQLIKLVAELGTKWTRIAQQIKGRSTTKLSSRYSWLQKHGDTSVCSSSDLSLQPQVPENPLPSSSLPLNPPSINQMGRMWDSAVDWRSCHCGLQMTACACDEQVRGRVSATSLGIISAPCSRSS
eukprot:c4482_g1_i1.p1 GENE.c4482_g1_i1~~c4482_g1_i1.p1  ORF type:complete len:413 (-),score=25.64 c4482_g1_i1:468-1706(-)